MKKEKARVDLVPPEIIYSMAEAFEDGARKRSERNWEIGPSSKKWSYVDRIAAIIRHALALSMGEDVASDSKIYHAGHIAANAAMLVAAMERGNIGVDDRVMKKNPESRKLSSKDSQIFCG